MLCLKNLNLTTTKCHDNRENQRSFPVITDENEKKKHGEQYTKEKEKRKPQSKSSLKVQSAL